MSRVITIDPGISKCGVIIADIKEKKVYEAVVIKSHLLLQYVKKKYQSGKNVQLLIGNGTCLLYTSPSPRDATLSRMPSSA